MLSDRCLSVCLSCHVCLSVRLVYCCQTVGWIKMPLGMQVGLGPGITVNLYMVVLCLIAWTWDMMLHYKTWEVRVAHLSRKNIYAKVYGCSANGKCRSTNSYFSDTTYSQLFLTISEGFPCKLSVSFCLQRWTITPSVIFLPPPRTIFLLTFDYTPIVFPHLSPVYTTQPVVKPVVW